MPGTIARPSVASLFLVTLCNGVDVSTATGFVVERSGSAYLITNYHVLAARNPVTGANLHSSAAWPDEVVILHNLANELGSWCGEREPLRDTRGPRWLVHPTQQQRVDVVALPLTKTAGYELYSHALEGGPDLALGVAQQLSIVGFPFGRTGGGAFGIWVQGTVATEPAVDFDGLPCFLVDSRTRQGQSGSPVLIYNAGGMVPMSDGGVAMFGGPVERLIGVYSGRISAESDLGVVWRRDVISEIIDGSQRGTD